jgi:hypothetical protein
MRGMKKLLAIVLALALSPSLWAQPKAYPYRWVFVIRSLRSDRDVDEIREIAKTAAEHGLNGMVLSSGLDRLELQPPEYVGRVKKVKAILDEYHLELIPQIFSAGYGSGVLAFDKNLAEGIPVRNALFVVEGGEARLRPDPEVAFLNGGLEDYAGNKVRGFNFNEQPGVISFVDTEVFKEGKASLRFENFTANEHGHGRLMQEIAVRPHRAYRLSCWVKTEALEPARAFQVSALAPDGRALAPTTFDIPATADWRKLVMGFNSAAYEKVRIYAGVWGGKSGKFWLDDFRIEEVGLVNVLRRSGTPVVVRNEKTGTVCEEGRDYAPIADPKLNFRFDHDGPPLRIPSGSRIAEGDRLRVDYYHGMAVHEGQVTVCMSEPKLYRTWREQARRLHELLAANKYLLSMDEIRAGGSDAACKQRGLTMGEILGDCFTQQFKMLRELNPKAEVFTWSDMLDPNHNAHANYYLVDGDYTGSWNHVPREMRIVCWYFNKHKESLVFFPGSVSRRSPALITMATRWTTPRPGWSRWIRPTARSASCTPPGGTSTSCWPPSAI